MDNFNKVIQILLDKYPNVKFEFKLSGDINILHVDGEETAAKVDAKLFDEISAYKFIDPVRECADIIFEWIDQGKIKINNTQNS